MNDIIEIKTSDATLITNLRAKTRSVELQIFSLGELIGFNKKWYVQSYQYEKDTYIFRLVEVKEVRA